MVIDTVELVTHLQDRAKKFERGIWIFVGITLLMIVFLWGAQKRIYKLEMSLAAAEATIQAKEQEIRDFDMEARHSIWWAKALPPKAKEAVMKAYEEEKIKHLPEYP